MYRTAPATLGLLNMSSLFTFSIIVAVQLATLWLGRLKCAPVLFFNLVCSQYVQRLCPINFFHFLLYGDKQIVEASLHCKL